MRTRRWIIGGCLTLGMMAWWQLELAWAQLIPHAGGLTIALDFFRAALSPAWEYQAEFIPLESPPFLLVVLQGLGRTIAFALASMSMALPLGIALGLCASRLCHPAIRWTARVFAAFLRSIHELLWAVLFLAAIGMSNGTAVLALALPFTGTLAKILGEMLDETDDDAFLALKGLGASNSLGFFAGLLPRALPDFAAYAFYRLECALRSSAVLGFFGYPTAGYYLKTSFDNLHFEEVWTWLYALIALVLLFEAWSSHLRRRFVA
ncbi:MAG: ABC transporter permease subunit [Planctomycetes bacterium]|nr:ABC transporter permease subunit [Planctomycetota bacterium]